MKNFSINSRRVVFMGTPQFAVPCLEMLLAEECFNVVGVVTQPDKKQGRGNKLTPSPVKECAVLHEVLVLQPTKLREESAWRSVAELRPDLIVVVAYGQLLPQELLSLPQFGCINVHGSLLPKYRGAAPMQYALMNGDEKTGVTIMYMDIGMDTGDMIAKEEIQLFPGDTLGTLHDKMQVVGAECLKKTLFDIVAGRASRESQEGALASYSPRIAKEDERVDWSKSAVSINNLLRALNPVPGAFALFRNKRVKIWRAKPTEKLAKMAIGSVVHITGESFFVSTGIGELEVLEVQVEGGKKINAGDFIRGGKVLVGEKFS